MPWSLAPAGFQWFEESVSKAHYNSIANVGGLQQATVQKVHASGSKQGSTEKGGAWVLDQLNLEGLDQWTDDQKKAAKELLVASADVFSKDELDLGKCNILKHDIKITDPQPFKERY